MGKRKRPRILSAEPSVIVFFRIGLNDASLLFHLMDMLQQYIFNVVRQGTVFSGCQSPDFVKDFIFKRRVNTLLFVAIKYILHLIGLDILYGSFLTLYTVT